MAQDSWLIGGGSPRRLHGESAPIRPRPQFSALSPQPFVLSSQPFVLSSQPFHRGTSMLARTTDPIFSPAAALAGLIFLVAATRLAAHDRPSGPLHKTRSA